MSRALGIHAMAERLLELEKKIKDIKKLIECPTYHISTLKSAIRRILEVDQSIGED